MHYGSPIPITAFPDFDAVKDYVQTLEGEGFDVLCLSGRGDKDLSEYVRRMSEAP